MAVCLLTYYTKVLHQRPVLATAYSNVSCACHVMSCRVMSCHVIMFRHVM